MRYVFFTDVHEFGPHEMKVDWEYHAHAFYLGDNVDLKCCKPEDVKKAEKRLAYYQYWFKNPVVLGNHELAQDDNDFIIHKNILMTHGDYLFWDIKRADAYRAQKPGLPAFRRWAYNVVFGFIAPFFARFLPIPKIALDRAVAFAKLFKCPTVICGHWHPHKLQDLTYQGVRIIILPRGKTEIDL